jgi:uncharacterized membrane protein
MSWSYVGFLFVVLGYVLNSWDNTDERKFRTRVMCALLGIAIMLLYR